MKNLRALLERFSKVLNKDSLSKEIISKIVEEKAKVRLTRKDFSLKDGILEISAGPSSKNEICLKEESILAELKLNKIFVSRFLYK